MKYIISNKNGMTASFIDLGARWTGLAFKDADGVYGDVVLGFDDEKSYAAAGERYHGAIVGRVCGRMKDASFELDGRTYELAANDSFGSPVRNHIHGGIKAFHNRRWEAEKGVNAKGEEYLRFVLFSAYGEEGYPGDLSVTVEYTLTEDNVVRMTIDASADTHTPFAPTNHTFFNMNPSEDTVLSQILTVAASSVLEHDSNLLPTGRILPVEDTPLDFRRGRVFGSSLRHSGACTDRLVVEGRGCTVAFILDTELDLRFAARLESESSGRVLEIYTDCPSLQIYNGYYMDGSDIGKGGKAYISGAGLAIEPQAYTDAMHHPEFPSIVIGPDKAYHSVTEYRFYSKRKN